jgi:adenylylsulfate kinase
MSALDRPHIVGHPGKLTNTDRESFLKQKGAVVWFTGLSGSEKSTVAREVERALVENGKNAFVIDGDNIRLGLNKDLGFSDAERIENIRRIGEVSKLLFESNVICLSAFIAPYREERARVRAMLPAGRFFEIYCAATLAECEARDVKGLYRKARAGEVAQFTGISSPYEPPEKAELTLFTGGKETLEQSARKVLELLSLQKLI